MLKKIIAIIVLVATYNFAFGQNESSHWFFGDKAGIRFENGTVSELSSGMLNSESGCCAISDPTTGALTAYSNGISVWDRNHNLMQNGDSLYASIGINQNSIMLGSPTNHNNTFLFSISSTIDSLSKGLYYSIIDRSLNNGNGAVIKKNTLIVTDVYEKITAIDHCNGTDYWLVCHRKIDSSYYSFLINNDTAISTKVIYKTSFSINNDLGYLNFSPSGAFILSPINQGNILAALYSFNNNTGELSDVKYIYRTDFSYTYGVAFSADGRYLYISTGGEQYILLQYDLLYDSEEDINNSRKVIAEGNIYALQIALDERIYISKVNENNLAIINHPGKPGKSCSFDYNGFQLNYGTCRMGLPNFNQSDFYKPKFYTQNHCFGDTTEFLIMNPERYSSINWYLKDATGNYKLFSTFSNPNYYFEKPGEYTILAVLDRNCRQDTLIQQVKISSTEPIQIMQSNDFCDASEITLSLDGSYDSTIWNHEIYSNYLEINSPGAYNATAYKHGCPNIDSLYVEGCNNKVYVPNAFSPNNDGINDEFKISSATGLSDFRLMIANKQGTILFDISNPEMGWDGKYKNEACPTGAYSFFIQYSLIGDNEQVLEKKGVFILIK